MLLSREAILTRFHGDWSLFQTVVKMYLAELPRQLADLRTEAAGTNPARVHAAIHALRGVCANFSGDIVWKTALDLESQIKARQESPAKESLEKLIVEIQTLASELQSFVE